MIFLNTTDVLEAVTDSVATVDSMTSSVVNNGGVVTPSTPQLANISSATTTTVVSAPGAGILNLKYGSWRNKDAVNSVNLTIRLNRSAGGTIVELHKEALSPGEELVYLENLGFFPVNPILSTQRLMSFIEQSASQRTFRSQLSAHGNLHTFTPTSAVAYAVYLGRTTQDITPKFVEFHITAAGSGTDTKEVGFFSSPAAPSKAGQTLTKLVATGTVDAGTSTGAKRNTTAFSTLIPAGTHLWAVARFALATTQPTCAGIGGDMAEGMSLQLTGASALTGITTLACTVPTIGTTTNSPDLAGVLD